MSGCFEDRWAIEEGERRDVRGECRIVPRRRRMCARSWYEGNENFVGGGENSEQEKEMERDVMRESRQYNVSF